jgi:6-pyruvoyltetrahydropterin/6-carboxytetrahydropterin synthase
MYEVTRKIPFCYGHRLLNYSGKCRNLHGHNGTAVITIRSQELDELGMVMDFSDIKAVVSKWIDEELDHRLLLHKDDPAIPWLRELNEPIVVMDINPTAENIARHIYDFVASCGFPVTEVTLWETDNCFATYSPGPAQRPESEKLAAVIGAK